MALDTNVLVYAEGVNGADRSATATRLLKEFSDADVVVPLQALAELFMVLTAEG